MLQTQNTTANTTNDLTHMKVAVVGCGEVGATFAYALTMKGLVHEIGLINRTPEKAEGEAMDLRQGLPFVSPVDINAGGYELCKDAQIVVITAGAAQDPGESRLDVALKNTEIVKKIIPQIMEHNPDPIILMVTNPVDVLTYVALKESGLDPKQVLGSGTVLDSARFRRRLAEHINVDSRNVHSHIIGEHGDSEIAVWSRVNIAGAPLQEYCSICNNSINDDFRNMILQDVRNAAYEIIKRKGATYYAVGLVLVRIVEAILKNQRSVLTVSGLVQDYYGISDVCLSLPRVLGRSGIEHTITSSLESDEVIGLQQSAEVLQGVLKDVGMR